MKTFTIDGNNFSDLEGFYDEIDKILTKDLEWKTGHNLDAYNDFLVMTASQNCVNDGVCTREGGKNDHENQQCD